ncbi:MAG: hypothetical protein CO128_05785 [Ignavibacteriales bacterium CG_4_9_14_3_um_filter_30_11]|nr:MAG: hypothetical protein CO128_05785 [Ignavibacteriales bacterium CG_4_9_14_3_um_filter_30_11]
MNILKYIRNTIFNILNSRENNLKSPKDAYDIWADSYGLDNYNLTLHYDNIIINKFLSEIDVKDKTVFDYGCGTGINWEVILQKNPSNLIGCDISQNMINQLKKNFPDAEVYKTDNLSLSFLPKNSCDIIISTLVIAHIKDIQKMFSEWERVLKNKSEIFITDFHPNLLSKGGKRTFSIGKELIIIENYCHTIKTIEEILAQFGFKKINLIEFKIDEEVKQFYNEQNAIKVYNKFYNTPFIYGLHLSR